jgi:hypothetical protein
MITGVVSSIQTVISSSGSAIQNISFRACRALPPGINALSSEGEEDLLELITQPL